MIIILKKAVTSVLDIKTLKAHLRIDHDYEDDYLNILANAATDILEKAIGISIMKKKYKYIGDSVDPLPVQPVIKINSRKNREIIFTAGIADEAEAIPIDLKYAVLQIAKNMYECNDDNILNSHYIQHIINSYKQITVI